MNSHLLPSDTNWPEDKQLMAELSHLNTQVTRYIFNLLDADAGRGTINSGDEKALGLSLVELGNRLQARATSRDTRATDNRT